jgi:hypothetical protein
VADHELNELTAAVPSGHLESYRSSADLKFGMILRSGSLKCGTLFEQYLKIVALAILLFLVLPAMLILSVVALLIARVLGVPLFSHPPP